MSPGSGPVTRCSAGPTAFAEYACPPEDQFAANPAALSFEQAAVVPISGFAALKTQ
jgi:NADPH:quinone reductase-like Zn-dependent oxidoreductase